MPHRAILRPVLPLALILAGQAALGQAAEPDINPTEQMLADILIGMAAVELKLAEVTSTPIAPPPASGDLIEDTRQRIVTLSGVEPEKQQALVAPEQPESADFKALTVDGRTVQSALKADLVDSQKANLPDQAACGELGDWFLTLDLQRDSLTLFVRDGEFVRICSFIGNVWRVRTAENQTRAHLVTIAD